MMKGIEFAEVRDAIARAFNADEFDMFLRERLNFTRSDYVADGPFRVVVAQVLQQFENEGRDPFLIAEVAAVRPLKADVQEVYRKYAQRLIGEARHETIEAEKLKALERYGLAPKVDLQRAGKAQLPVPTSATHEGFERLVKQTLPFVNPRLWGAQLFKHEPRVCLIEFDGAPRGTGFLVGPDAVLTNHHVLEQAIESKAGGDRIACLFDYRVLTSGTESEGTRVKVAPAWADWHIDSSPGLDDAVEKAGFPLPTADQLDHALIRLGHPFGAEPIYERGPVRGWVRVPQTAPTITEKMPIMILQHPKTEPVKLAFDTEAVQSVNKNRTRVRYTTNTEKGSSGSPCYNVNWSLVALHHFGEPGKDPATYNQGVPIDAVRDRLTRVGKADALGSDPPA